MNWFSGVLCFITCTRLTVQLTLTGISLPASVSRYIIIFVYYLNYGEYCLIDDRIEQVFMSQSLWKYKLKIKRNNSEMNVLIILNDMKCLIKNISCLRISRNFLSLHEKVSVLI